ncbi:MAG: Na-K-Cl cotransporter [Myxococcota bacterium]
MTAPGPESSAGDRAAGRFGTFGGVFTPSILTILGVIMYLRLGWVTGQAGLAGTLVVIVVAHLISYATGLSVASIATNRTVGAGGAYFMISRSLGAAAGAAIGIPLFFAQGLSVTFYIVGFTEALMPLVPEPARAVLSPLLISTLVNLLLTGLSLKSADLAIKAQYFVMGTIVLSLVSFFGGQTADFPREIEWTNADGAGFGAVFAIFFPAVTGIMAGVGMSGDLADPRRSIPRGTLLAITVGMLVYLAFPVWLALNFDNATLIAEPDATFQVAAFPQLIYLGVWGATLSSALGSILTAPRTLQALAWDGLVPRFLGRGSGPAQEPRVGIVLTFVLAQTGLLLGSLDAIAPVLTMFFLATYGVTNFACGLQRWSASPSFRPGFKVPSVLSLGGGAACFYVMSVIDLPAMVAALFFCGLIFAIASRRALGTTYGDSRHGIWAALVRFSLQRLRRVDWHPLNWRPNLVILGGDPTKRPHLLELGSAIVQDRGIVTYFHLLRGKVAEHASLRRHLRDNEESHFVHEFPNVFYRVDVVDDVYRGTVQVAQSYGVGSFEANCVMAGWPRKRERGEAYVRMCRDLLSLDRSLLLVRKGDGSKKRARRPVVHVWWGGLQGNGGLMLLIAFLLTNHHRWRRASVKVITVVDAVEDRARAEANLKELLEAARLDAEPRVLVRGGSRISEVMKVESEGADLAIVGFRLPPVDSDVEPFFERMNRMLAALPTTILVHSAQGFEGEPVLFDEGTRPTAEVPAPASGDGTTSSEMAAFAAAESQSVPPPEAPSPPTPSPPADESTGAFSGHFPLESPDDDP